MNKHANVYVIHTTRSVDIKNPLVTMTSCFNISMAAHQVMLGSINGILVKMFIKKHDAPK